MAFNIIISKRATLSLEKILDYTIHEFGINVHDNLLNKIENTIYTISLNPFLFPKVNDTFIGFWS